MIGTDVIAILLASGMAGAASAPSAPEPALPDRPDRIEYAQVTIRQRVIVRIPARAAPATVRWKEKKGPRCAPMKDIAGAAIVKPDSVDILFRGGVRLRAILTSECPALDYYRGFYITPSKDGRICADRDAIHARSGGECQIERFRILVPDP